MKRAAVIIASVLVLATSFVAADAQRRTKPRARPLATPVPTVSGAEIISQAGDYQDPNQTQPEPTATPRPPSATATRLNNIDARLKAVEGQSASDPDAKQKRLLLNLDILNRAEQRADNLRKQVFEMIDKENGVQKRLDEIAYAIQPEVIERELQLAGSMRPEEVRDNRRKQLASEQSNLQSLLSQVQTTRASLEASLAKADDMVSKLRAKLEKDIDDSFLNDDRAPDKPDDQPNP
jgi:hypothetical protein